MGCGLAKWAVGWQNGLWAGKMGCGLAKSLQGMRRFPPQNYQDRLYFQPNSFPVILAINQFNAQNLLL